MKRIVLILLFVPLSAGAWTAPSDQHIAARGAELGPPDLRLVIARFSRQYDEGLRRAEADEGSDIHHFFVTSKEGKLRERLERDTRGIIRMVRTNVPMSQIVERLGILAHLVADANNPLRVADEQPADDLPREDFEHYIERTMDRFPTVLYNVDSQFDLGTYLDGVIGRTSKLYPLIDEEYFRFGQVRTSNDFDDRSTAFGVASVCYSHAVTDIVNLYYYIWREAGGNVRSAPTIARSTDTSLHAN